VKARGVPLWYVEGLNDARTLLADFFSILLAGTFKPVQTAGPCLRIEGAQSLFLRG
jgi:hypothetical protein